MHDFFTSKGSKSKTGMSERAFPASLKSSTTNLMRFLMIRTMSEIMTVMTVAMIADTKYVITFSLSGSFLYCAYFTHKKIVAMRLTTMEAKRTIHTTNPTTNRKSTRMMNENANEIMQT